ncbi:hypothetical protein XELAEV_18040771mg [Xenopus laevis]|uniref:Uncharacterized protein n=1 Tax=Xenopus laevis TaxID=8355 RepID=A0A974CA46_XENLA|nr:hypothetical protein XELAEV_18040771mg [Xenopus laevis]
MTRESLGLSWGIRRVCWTWARGPGGGCYFPPHLPAAGTGNPGSAGSLFAVGWAAQSPCSHLVFIITGNWHYRATGAPGLFLLSV